MWNPFVRKSRKPYLGVTKSHLAFCRRALHPVAEDRSLLEKPRTCGLLEEPRELGDGGGLGVAVDAIPANLDKTVRIRERPVRSRFRHYLPPSRPSNLARICFAFDRYFRK